jgi:prolyl-tRNA editing enzyme YbaK/EbsC (Cys-tRNA(Pro) deacylase)
VAELTPPPELPPGGSRAALPGESLAALAAVDLAAVEGLLARIAAAGVRHELRQHEPARHARHLAAIWGVPLHQAGRATLFYADGAPVLAVVPADRKVSAPRLRAVLGASELRVLRGDRGVGRLGWRGLPGEAGVLPAVPGLYRARCLIEVRLLEEARLVFAVSVDRSVAMAAADYRLVTGAVGARLIGVTRLLPEGGMVDDAVGREGFEPP